MSDAIFLIRDGQLVELSSQPYDSESLLQRLLADYPNLLAGRQIDGAAPRRWLLVSREMGVPSEEDGGRRWSLDHLFLDQDGIPTLVEVKRSADGRIRREVVGQLLDYAANAVAYWPIEEIQSRFQARCDADGLDFTAEVSSLIGGEDAVDAFWLRVKTNLHAGRVRLIFVADVIPPELQRIVEFLNRQMDPAEVLALEVKQYVGEDMQTLVPRVVGQNAEAQQKRAAAQRGGGTWNEASFFTLIEARNGGSVARVARQIFAWASLRGRIWYGSGKRDGSFGLSVEVNGKTRYPFAVFTYGAIEIYFQWLRNSPAFHDEERRRELLDRLNVIDEIALPADAIGRRPSIKLATLLPPERLRRFLDVLDWVVSELKGGERTR